LKSIILQLRQPICKILNLISKPINFVHLELMPDQNHIPSHNLESGSESIQIKEIAHKNHYDFTRQHRHTYFEVMWFNQGGGKNLIDFKEYEVKSNSCYIIYPGQVHLLNRAPGSHGYVIQFQTPVIASTKLQQLLEVRLWTGQSAILFEKNKSLIAQLNQYKDLIVSSQINKPKHFKEIQRHLLQALLFDLVSTPIQTEDHSQKQPEIYRFLQLIDQYFKKEQKVSFYFKHLSISEKKLASLTKKHLGDSPLQIVHKRILLEAKRLLLFGELNHKEIAYDLGFDSPASFSAFIKNKTGLTASQIQDEMAEIHKR